MSLLLVLSLGAGAQEDEPLQTYLREVMTAEDVESSTWEDVYDQLCYLAQHPFDLNTSTRAQLEELPFLSAQQIEELMDYLYHYGPMKSKGELLMIRSLASRTDGDCPYPLSEEGRHLSGIPLAPLAALSVQ